LLSFPNVGITPKPDREVREATGVSHEFPNAPHCRDPLPVDVHGPAPFRCRSRLYYRAVLIAARDHGQPDFLALPHGRHVPVCLYWFDLLELQGRDLR
jgi:ATP dependent DNA ligase domain